jgi:hypothetical protein
MPRRCRHCREYCIPKDAPKSQFVCSLACSIGYGRAQVAKRNAAKQKTEKKQRVEKVRNFRLADRSHQVMLTQKDFNRMIRLLDKDKGCISCDRGPQWQGQWHAGHYLTTGAMPSLRFDARNCHKQCSVCNNHLSGNLAEYTRRLELRHPGITDWLRGAHETHKFTILELTIKRRTFSAECRRLEAGQGPSRNWREIPQEQEVAAA